MSDVVATSSEALVNEVTTTVGAMPEVVHMTSEVRAEATTSSNALAEEEPTTKNTPSVLLLYRIGEASQATGCKENTRQHPNTKAGRRWVSI